jgi:hypothetical protein
MHSNPCGLLCCIHVALFQIPGDGSVCSRDPLIDPVAEVKQVSHEDLHNGIVIDGFEHRNSTATDVFLFRLTIAGDESGGGCEASALVILSRRRSR